MSCVSLAQLTLVLLQKRQSDPRHAQRSPDVNLSDSLHLLDIALSEEHRLVVRETDIVDQHSKLYVADGRLEALVVGVGCVEEVDGNGLDLG